MHLDDKTTLGEYGIPEDSIVYLSPEVVKVKVTLPTGQTRDKKILPSDTVITLNLTPHPHPSPLTPHPSPSPSPSPSEL
jgi:hypothetical protein